MFLTVLKNKTILYNVYFVSESSNDWQHLRKSDRSKTENQEIVHPTSVANEKYFQTKEKLVMITS